jgi:hypothetical protein
MNMATKHMIAHTNGLRCISMATIAPTTAANMQAIRVAMAPPPSAMMLAASKCADGARIHLTPPPGATPWSRTEYQ